VTLYRLLTGKHPFDGAGQLAVVEKILSKRPRPPRSIEASAPDDLAELAMALVEKDAKDRPRADEVYGRIVERVAARPARVGGVSCTHEARAHDVVAGARRSCAGHGRAHQRGRVDDRRRAL
jgi:serine/threonine protein kinase